MPIEIKIQHNGVGVLYNCYGVLTGKDFIDANNKILAFGHELKQLRYGLIDELAVGKIIISSSETLTIAEQEKKIARFIPYGAVLAVIVENTFTFGHSLLWGSAIECADWEITTFNNKKKAENWVITKMKENFGLDLAFLQNSAVYGLAGHC